MAVIRAITAAILLMTVSGIARGDAVPDPTRPPTAAEIRAWRGTADARETQWRLESVLISDRRRVAVINGHTVGAGDTVDGARVLAIEPGRVRLDAGDGQLDLSLQAAGNNDNIRQDGSR